MMTWAEFNQAVNELLIVDGVRRGVGVEKFRDRMILAGSRDLQRFIPGLRLTPAEVSFSPSDLTEHSEGKCDVGSLDYEGLRILDVKVRRLPQKMDGVSTYYPIHVYPASKRTTIWDGGHVARSSEYPGKITFDRGKFYTAPTLKENELLQILYQQEINYKPLFSCTLAEKSQKTQFGDDEALAVHYYVKYHFMKDVSDDQNQAQTNFQNYQRERRSIYSNMGNLAPVSNPQSSINQGGLVLGDG